MSIKPITEMKLNVRPVTVALHHDYVFEGPCRFGEGDQLTAEYDQTLNHMISGGFQKCLETQFDPDKVHFLDHIWIDRNEEFKITDDDMDLVAQDLDKVDAFFVCQALRTYDFIIEMAVRFKKPVIVSPTFAVDTITTAAIAAKGLPVFPVRNYDDVRRHFDVLRVKKQLNNMRVLACCRLSSDRSMPSAPDGFLSTEDVTDRMGIRFCFADPHELLDSTRYIKEQTPYDEATTNHTTPGRVGLNPNDEDMAEINRITDEFIAGAAECEMTREDIFNSVKAWYVVQKFMAYNDCNAFTIPCPDICATRRLNKERITFCLSHSLNQEMGLPSACEYDMPALVAQAILMGFSNAAPYMGNCENGNLPADLGGGFWGEGGMFKHPSTRSIDLPAVLKAQQEQKLDCVIVTHAVPNRKFKGFKSENSSYAIRSFARSGFGATIRYDFKQDVGQVVTLLRVDPTCSKLFVAKGTVVGGLGYKDTNCSEGVFVAIKNHEDFFEKQSYFGNHVPLAYGDYVREIKELGKLLNMEVVEA